MSLNYSDQTRLLGFKADGKSDFLFPKSFTATERMSGLFNVRVDLFVASENASQIQAEQLLGKRMTLRVSLGRDYTKGPYRYFDGVCCRFASVGKDDRHHHFEAEIVPWMWMLTKRADCRVFQDESVPDIVESILGELQSDFPEFKYEIRANKGKYKKIDYCVQFRETQFNFISRLLENEGIYYYFEHTDSGHTLIIDDSLTAGNDVPNQSQVNYIKESGPDEFTRDNIATWREDRIIHSGKFAARDYHFQMAQNKIDISGITPKTNIASNDKLEIYDWQAGSALRYNNTDQRLDEVDSVGTTLTNVRAQEAETTHHAFTGTGGCRGFTPGYRFSMKHDSGKKYLLTEIHHDAYQDPNYVTGEVIEGAYRNSFLSILADTQFRPRRVTPKPIVDGLQSAKVVGKSGEEIWIDKYGRVRVQFFWDRKGKEDEKSTCWVRVAQIAAGKRWGAYFWPRIDQEVLVAFLEGDPDQPVIVGSVYNNQQMPPYLGDGLDDEHKNDPDLSGIKTNSTKGGDGFNELRFCDTKDKEQVFIHAQKYMDVRVKDERRDTTVGDHYLIVGDPDNSDTGNLRQKVHQNWLAQTLKNKTEKVEGNSSFTVGAGSNGDGGNYDEYIEKNSTEYVGGNRNLQIVGNRNEKITGQTSLTASQLDAKFDQSAAIEAGTTLHLKAMTVVIEADMQLSLVVGGNFVDISVAGVAINGMPMVMINSGGAAGSAPDAQPASATQAQKIDNIPASTFHKADDSKTGNKSCD